MNNIDKMLIGIMILIAPAVAASCDVGISDTGFINPSVGCDPEIAMQIYPQIPMAIEAHRVWINGELAPAGSMITATGQNVRTYASYPDAVLILPRDGGVDDWGLTDQKLLVQGIPAPGNCSGQVAIPEGAPITFYVDGLPARVMIAENAGTFDDPSILIDDKPWVTTIPFQSGSAYLIDLLVGEIEPIVTPVPVITEPCKIWDRDHVQWSDKDFYWINKWRNNQNTADIVAKYELLACDWFVPTYIPNWVAINASSNRDQWTRIVWFAEHGGYGCQPNLTAIIQGQNWHYETYGIPYYGPPSENTWRRLLASDAEKYGMPSMFIPPNNHPLFSSYVPVKPVTSVLQEVEIEPTTTIPLPTQTTPITTIPTAVPTTISLPVTTVPIVKREIPPQVAPSILPTPVSSLGYAGTQEGTPHNVKVYYTEMPKTECSSGDPYVPLGYGVLRLGAGSSNSFWYLNGALVSNDGGVAVLKGMKPGNYLLSYRERYYDPVDFELVVRANMMTIVELYPEGSGLLGVIGWPPDWLKDTAPEIKENIWPKYSDLSDRKSPVGDYQIGTWHTGTDVFIDDMLVARGCDIPCDFTIHGVAPGIHTVSYVTGFYESQFPVIICAGTRTTIGGGAAVSGPDCPRGDCTYSGMDPMNLYRGIEDIAFQTGGLPWIPT